MEVVTVTQFLQRAKVYQLMNPVYNAGIYKTGATMFCCAGDVYLGSANVKTQHLGSDLQRLCMEDLSYHPETCLDNTNAMQAFQV